MQVFLDECDQVFELVLEVDELLVAWVFGEGEFDLGELVLSSAYGQSQAVPPSHCAIKQAYLVRLNVLGVHGECD